MQKSANLSWAKQKAQKSWASSCNSSTDPLPKTCETYKNSVIKVHGIYVLDHSSTKEELREFFHSGLRFIEKEASAKNIPAEVKRKLVTKAFDCFYDVTDGLWNSLKECCISAEKEMQMQEDNSDVPQPIDFYYKHEYEVTFPNDME